MLTAKNHVSGPVAIRYPRASTTGVDVARPMKEVPIGKAEWIREGDGSAAILSYGHVFGRVVEAGDALLADGIDAAIVNARFAKPLDLDMLRTVAAKYSVIVSVEEGAQPAASAAPSTRRL